MFLHCIFSFHLREMPVDLDDNALSGLQCGCTSVLVQREVGGHKINGSQ